jgi:anti-anti-sigma regulatory factor
VSLSLSAETKGEATVIHAEGGLAAHTAPRLKEAIEQVCGDGRLVIEFSGMHFVDSQVAGTLAC